MPVLSISSFKDYLEIIVSMKDGLEILKYTPQMGTNPQRYYVRTGGHSFRIVIFDKNRIRGFTEIGFEWEYRPDSWTTSGINNILSTKHLMKLFGTIKQLVKENNYSTIVVGVDNENDPQYTKKLNSYRGILRFVQKDLGYKISPTEEELSKLSIEEMKEINYVLLCKEGMTKVNKYLTMKGAKLNRYH